MNKKEVLIQAQKTSAIVKVVYKKGSQPNHARKIIPLKVEETQVFARCLNSNTDRHFLIKNLKLLTGLQYFFYPKWDPKLIQATDYELYEIHKIHRKKMESVFFPLLVILILLVIYLKFR